MKTKNENYSIEEQLRDKEELARLHARVSHLHFMNYCWQKGRDNPFIPGFHTKKICARIDKGFEDYRKGISTNLLIAVHHRSGKSDIVSKYLGPHWLGEFPDTEVMQVSYQAMLAGKFSAFGRNIVRSSSYRRVYPHLGLSRETNKKNDWLIVDAKGETTGGSLYASGLYSGLTGNGYALGILDDYFAGRKQAESLVMRDNAWEAFTDDFMTRAAPVHFRIVLATQWHWDDINGRIKKAMETDPNFPKFEILSFPAKASDYKGEGKYPGKYLFLERYDERWYDEQRSTLGKYGAAALLDCDPQFRTGGVLSTDGIVWTEEKDMPSIESLKWWRVWDLAHTAKQRTGDDPDWTSGTLLAFERRVGDPVPHLYVRDVLRTREGAVKRDDEIKRRAILDGKFVKQYVEDSLDAKDASVYIKNILPEYNVNSINTSGKGDKLVRVTPLEPIFEAKGHVHVMIAKWNDDWLDEVIRFNGSGDGHDDQIDNLSAGYIIFNTGAELSAETSSALAARNRR